MATTATPAQCRSRYRDGSQRNGVPIDEAVQLIVDHVTSRSNADPTAA